MKYLKNVITQCVVKVRLFLRMRDSYTNPYESKQIESFEIFGLTNRIHEIGIWKKFLRILITIRVVRNWVYETNPRNESLRFGFANPDSRICEVRIRDTIRNKSFWSQDSWLRYETNPWIRETNPRFYESLIRIPHP